MSKEYSTGNEPSRRFNEIISGNYKPEDMDKISRIVKLQEDAAKFEGDNLLTFLGHSASHMLRVASTEGVTERAKLDKQINPVTVNIGDVKHVVGYVKQVPSEDPTKPPKNMSHLVVMNNGEIFETEALSDEDKQNYTEVMSKRFALSGVELDEKGKISADATKKLFSFLELEKGVHIKSTHANPAIYEVVQRTLGIDPVLSKHVEKEYEPIVREKADSVIEGVEDILRRVESKPLEQKPEGIVMLDHPSIPLPRNPTNDETLGE